ncbi:hypothetical protein AZ66_03705 [Paenibacillus sp. E194]|nr:hypothetical protein AZ66_03705 [Paenibacillus sp. E194]
MEQNGQQRKHIFAGLEVDIVLKTGSAYGQDDKRYREGYSDEFSISSAWHQGTPAGWTSRQSEVDFPYIITR